MSDYHLYLDDSGTLKSNIFYGIEVPGDDSFIFNPKSEGWTHYSNRSPTEEELTLLRHENKSMSQWFRGEIIDEKFVQKKHCQSDKNHVTAEYASYLKLNPDYDENTLFSEFNLARSESWEHPLVTESFKERIQNSGLVGAGFLPVSVSAQYQKRYPNAPLLFAIQHRGENCLRWLSLQGAKDECPFCARKNLFCKTCGSDNLMCPKCDRYIATSIDGHDGRSDKRLKFSPAAQRETKIIEGSQWDGADFIFGGGHTSTNPEIISKRALDWLISIHAAPFCARPVQFCIDGMTDQQLQQLEIVQKPILT